MGADVDKLRHEARVELFSDQDLTVGAWTWNTGAVSLEGQDLSGGDKYEYFFMIAPADVPLIRSALGDESDRGILDVLAENGAMIVRTGEMTWLKRHQIPYEFHSC